MTCAVTDSNADGPTHAVGRSLLASGLLLAAVAAPAGAVPDTPTIDEATETSVIDEMVEPPVISVTATRVAAEVEKTPAAVSIIDHEEVEQVKFVDSRTELLKRIPGYSMIRNLRIPMGGKNYTINLIDGLAVSSAFGSGTIGSLEDTNTFDVERVEVIRGPASALYGSNALGGVINVITRRPPAQPEYRVWAEGGGYERIRGGASAAGSTDSMGYFLDVNALDYEGWQDRTANRRQQASGKLLFDLDLDTVLTVRAEYLDTYLENPGSITQAQYEEDWSQALVYDAYNDEQVATGSARLEHDLDSRSGVEVSYGIRQRHSEGPPSYSATGGFSSTEELNQNLVGLYRRDFDLLDSQVIAGIDLLHSASDSTTYEARTTNSDIAQQWDITAVATSPFLQYELSPLDRVRVSLGARYDSIDYSAEGYKVSRGVTTDYDESTTFSQLSPKAGVTLDLGNHHSLWLGYGQGFVVPSRTYLFVGSRGYDPNPQLNPERASNYEVGLRGRLAAAHLDYDVVFYRTDITDMLVADDELEMYVNAAEVRVQGVETMLTFKPLKRWRFDLAHTYADNRYIDFVSGSDDYSGNALSASPLHHVNARATWLPIPGLSAELEWNHISPYHTSNANDDPEGKASRPDLFNLRITYRRGDWSFWGHALNLFDRKYAERVSYDSRDGREYVAGHPLTLYAGLSYTWR